jgi:saccharopine dehydrogenase-like NADP-dependent oxidoreductase
VEVKGEKDGRMAKARMWTVASYEETYRLRGTNAIGYLVGTGGAVATEMLIDGEAPGKGIVIPEQLSSDSYLRRLRGKGVEVREEVAYL